MAIICDDLKILFIMVPGTGCTVVGRALTDHFGGRFLPETDLVRNGRVTHSMKHNTVAQLIADGLLDEPTLKNHLVVATVRHPLDALTTSYQRLISGWQDQRFDYQERRLEGDRLGITPEEYQTRLDRLRRGRHKTARRRRLVEKMGFDLWVTLSSIRMLQTRITSKRSPSPMLVGVDVVIRFEKLEQGLNQALESAGATAPIVLHRRNQTPGKRPWRKYYGWSHRFVEWCHRGTLKRFGYLEERAQPTSSVVWLNTSTQRRLGSHG